MIDEQSKRQVALHVLDECDRAIQQAQTDLPGDMVLLELLKSARAEARRVCIECGALPAERLVVEPSPAIARD